VTENSEVVLIPGSNVQLPVSHTNDTVPSTIGDRRLCNDFRPREGSSPGDGLWVIGRSTMTTSS